MKPQPRNDTITTPPIRDIEELASATECTGLIPAGVPSEDEAEEYARLYGVHPIKPNDITQDGLTEKQKKKTAAELHGGSAAVF